mmetsp:Transcript_25739/g.70808  ORF Transcript_25739/g.70808 Transcript_25739/m.70808 type:complete len:204 (-) Transcript_25739:13-624(-)
MCRDSSIIAACISPQAVHRSSPLRCSSRPRPHRGHGTPPSRCCSKRAQSSSFCSRSMASASSRSRCSASSSSSRSSSCSRSSSASSSNTPSGSCQAGHPPPPPQASASLPQGSQAGRAARCTSAWRSSRATLRRPSAQEPCSSASSRRRPKSRSRPSRTRARHRARSSSVATVRPRSFTGCRAAGHAAGIMELHVQGLCGAPP